jgi:hypothetical protein
MSSATVPHIFNEIVNDSNIPAGTKIVAMDPVLPPQDCYWKKYKYRLEYKLINNYSSRDNLE